VKRLWIVAAASLLLGSIPASARVFPVQKKVSEPPPQEVPRMYLGPKAAVGHVPSDRNLLRLERSHPLALPTAASAALPKTVKVAVLRVQFQQEMPDDPLTTGDGQFDLRDPATFLAEAGHQFESAPHNKRFFETIMRAMARYYAVASNARLTITYDVYPQDSLSAYTLDSTMSWYGSRPPNDGLADFVIDAVTKADADPDLVFGDYDGYVIFHAGSDRQHDFSPVTPTPNDLYTGFVRLLEPDLFIPVDGGATLVKDAVVLPETATQDNRGTGLGGLVAHEFGHQLGLVDIYSTRTGTTQVGDFSLMDNDAQEVGVLLDTSWNPGVFFDLMPVFPDAWSRAYLGFVTPRVVLPDSILAHGANPDSVVPFFVSVAEGDLPALQVLKVPISAREYYLVEFRSIDSDNNIDPDWDPFGVGLRADSFFNIILGPTLCGDPRYIDSCRALGSDYDFQLPVESGGMLIWHVDEEVAYQLVPEFEGDPYLKNNFDANTLQWNRERRFLEIVEADGLVDFGGNYYTGYGSQKELFLGGYKDEFGPTTNPSTRSHTGAPSHLRFYDISPIYAPDASPDALPIHHMKVKIANERAAAGWPRAAGHASAPQLTVINGADEDTVLATANRYVLGWTGGGQALLAQLAGDRATDSTLLFDGSYRVDTLSALARADTSLATAPAVGTYTAAGDRAVAAVDARGVLHVWSFADGDADGWVDSVFAYDLGTPAPQPPLWFDPDGDGKDGLFVASADGVTLWWEDGVGPTAGSAGDSVRDWALVMPAGEIYGAVGDGISRLYPSVAATGLGRRFVSLVALDDDRDSTDALFARDERQLYRLQVEPVVQIEEQRDPGFVLTGVLASGDHDENGVPSIIVTTGSQMAVFQPNLFLEDNTPLRADDVVPGAPLSEAVTYGSKTIFGGADGEVQAYQPSGAQDFGWPFFAGATVLSIAVVRSGPDSSIVLARSASGQIWGSKIAGSAATPGAWTQSRGNARKQNRWNFDGAATPAPNAADLPEGSVYAYPNPASRGPVRIRYYLGTASDVQLSVYDLAGNEVTSATAHGSAGADNEWVWDASQVAPGVYFCRVATGGDGAVRFCKVAITP